jgi:hypothetical protein
MTRFFLDVEWADNLGSELVSIALVADNGIDFVYAEREFLPPHPTDFVRTVVYPLLDRGTTTLSDHAMTKRLREILNSACAPMIYADYANDLQLLRYVIAGFDLPDSQAAACGPLPEKLGMQVVNDSATAMLVEAYFEAHPKVRARRHHALVDAEALRLAWQVSTSRVPCPPWAINAMERAPRSPQR